MKLVDILARELKVWPEGTDVVGQAKDGTLHLGHTTSKINGWTKEKYAMGDDWNSAHVSRAQWQAAVDALKALREEVMYIDWSNAPEGATHFAPPRNGVNPLWAKSDGKYWAYHHFSENKEGWYVGLQPDKSDFFISRHKFAMPPASEAPNGATHWDPGSGCTPTWAMKCDGIWYWHPVYGEGIEDSWSPYSVVAHNPLNFIRIEQPWGGDGLPPVGTVCEIEQSGEWCRVEVVYLSKCTLLLKFDGDEENDNEAAFDPRDPDINLRPIRAPEQIVEEQLRRDELMYGASYAVTGEDGSLQRIDPTKIIIRHRAPAP